MYIHNYVQTTYILSLVMHRIVSESQDSVISEWRNMSEEVKKCCDQLLLTEGIFENVNKHDYVLKVCTYVCINCDKCVCVGGGAEN